MERRAARIGTVVLSVLLVGGLGVRCVPSDGFVSEEQQAARALDYLVYATSAQSRSVLNAIAHMERDRRDPTYTAPAGALDVADWSSIFEKLDDLQDTRDIDGLYLLNALLGYEGHPYLTPALWDRIRTALLSFKMWYTDPTPPVPDPDDPARDWDNSFYWTENHQILYHTIEYLAGQRFPDECFWIEGLPRTPDCSGPGEMTGAAHRDRAQQKILRWLDERWEIGFVEWHSNIYYQKDATPLLTLVEYAADEEIRTRAAMILDVLLMDMATHTWKTILGVNHGRSAMKDKYRGPTNDTWGIALLLFAQQQEIGYQSTGDAGATLFARARSYRLPRVIFQAANDPRSFEDRTRMSVPIDESAPIGSDPAHPPGHGYDDTEANFTFWWGLGAWTVWQIVPLTVINAERYNLWPTDLLRPFAMLRDILGEPPDILLGQNVALAFWPITSVGLLKEVNSYTWRTADYVLSTAQDYRKGANAGQVHAWQATLSADALVFTTHPMNAVQPPSEWIGRDEGEPGYWTGTASMPRSAQHQNVGIHIYSPLYGQGGLLGFFSYQPVTHAYFPQDHFDEVVQRGPWTFGREDGAYVALYSWRPTQWQPYAQAELDLLAPTPEGPVTHSFDLVAPGGPDNVWIVECARAREWDSFEAFQDAILAARVLVTPRPGTVPRVQEFDVLYESPSQGAMEFGWNAPFRVRGEELPLDGYPRMSNPWVHAERGAARITMQEAGNRLVLDWADATRRASGSDRIAEP